ncbi:MAG: bifunctional demethylmenaquinone methyltransferase/2-methoxy-6-polyprenyl-1,4-benzoquinol methylase UbiE [Lentimicrobiaceae bacterium]|nr:bifunctional demethylmenaquinone methyltransferase/2-methoxy-6-polyprenyl-1,4-benzoquinol methylase UbiE [Lentimicrobiaceae bacterium]
MSVPSSNYSDKSVVKDMFNNIAPKYDTLNRLLSFGIDKIWRKKLIKQLISNNPEKVLDVATGTGDLAFHLLKKHETEVVAVDISTNMMEIARQKAKKNNVTNVSFMEASAENLPFDDNSFDAVMVAFGIRNFADLNKGLTEMHRVLKIKGKVFILEFSEPNKLLLKNLYKFYSKQIIPVIGKLVSKNKYAYKYLPETIAEFPKNDKMVEIIVNNGYSNCIYYKYTGGICNLYVAEK